MPTPRGPLTPIGAASKQEGTVVTFGVIFVFGTKLESMESKDASIFNPNRQFAEFILVTNRFFPA